MIQIKTDKTIINNKSSNTKSIMFTLLNVYKIMREYYNDNNIQILNNYKGFKIGESQFNKNQLVRLKKLVNLNKYKRS